MHTHVLYGADDGPVHMEVAIHMLQSAAKEGVTDLIATPHAFHPKYHVPPKMIFSRISELMEITELMHIPIRLYTGHEVYLHEHLIEHVEQLSVLTLAGSRYLLVELPYYEVPAYTFRLIDDLLSRGCTPIIAHPERNTAIAANPLLLERMLRMGAHAQVTAGSITGQFGRKVQRTAMQFIHNHYIQCCGSDAHNLSSRASMFQKGIETVRKKAGVEMADMLLGNNQKILTDEPFTVWEPERKRMKNWRIPLLSERGRCI